MLVIQAPQLQQLARARLELFAQERRVHALRHHPQLSRFIGDAALQRAVAAGIAGARARGLHNRVEVALYLELALLLGSGFADDPRCPWAATLLAPGCPGSPLFRMRRTVEAATEWLDASHGPENAHLVRGLLRIRALTPDAFASAADAPGIVDWLTALLPQQAAACGTGAMHTLAEAALVRAARHGMTAPGDAATFALHQFMLGSAFDSDPLVPWAGPILAAGGSTRAADLFAASLRYLDAVLH